MSDETSFCKYCKRFVPATTFILHSTHCERFIQICVKCQEPFPKAQLEEHNNEVHKQIDCKDCNLKVEAREKSNHLANHCPKRLISCEYCEVQCIAGNIEDHEFACGSRTELCEICKNHILIRMLKIHKELHKKSTATDAYQDPSNIPNESRGKVSNVEDKNVHIPKFRNVVCQNIFQASAALPTIQQHPENMKKSSTKPVRNNEIIPTPQMEDENSLPCEFCGASCTFESLENHQMLCRSNLESCSHCQKYFSLGDLRSHICSSSTTEREPLKPSNCEEEYWSRYVEIAPAVKGGIVNEEDSIPCESCGSLFPISCLELHEIACKFSSISTNTESAIRGNEMQQTTVKLPEFQSTIDEEYWSQYATNAANIEESLAEKEDDIPCEICGILFPLSSLELHEVSCRYSSMSIGKEILPAKTENTVDQENRAYQSGNEVTFIPCSICNIVISSSILEMHEARCSNFFKQQTIRTKAVKCLPKKTEIRNARSENESQRTLRVNTLLATENRLPNTPIIQQSQYAVVQLPDGREILKKRNPTVDNNEIGHVLGRSFHKQHEYIDDGSSIRPKSVNSNLSNNMKGNHFDLGSEMNKEIQKSLFQQNNPDAKNRTRNHYIPGDVQKVNYREKKQVNTKPLSPDHSIEIRLSKKPNTAFTNYAYQPDAGNKLGCGNNSTNGRKQQQSNETTSTSRLQLVNTASANKEQTNPKELNSEMQKQDERDRNNGVFLGARPKRPKQ